MEIPPELIKLIAKDQKFAKLAAKCDYNINSAESKIIHRQKSTIWAKAKPARVANQATGLFKGPRLSTLNFRFGGVYKP